MNLFKPNPFRDVVDELAAISKHLKRGGDGVSYDIGGACATAAGIIIDLRHQVIAMSAENAALKEALRDMRFAYVNKDGDCPHGFETAALAKTEQLIGPFVGRRQDG